MKHKRILIISLILVGFALAGFTFWKRLTAQEAEPESDTNFFVIAFLCISSAITLLFNKRKK